MTQKTHFISDLHLCESQPHLSELFFYYMQNIAPSSQQLFVLGDLFEVWVGDDYISDLNQQVIQTFKCYSEKHGELLISHGNRDFLLGQKFAELCGAKLISEPFEFSWHDELTNSNKKISLMHGDSLCTDDIEYQKFRSMVRNPAWQQMFLNKSLEERLTIAGGIREQSKQAQKQKDTQIMDVNPNAVKKFFIDNQCDWLIHGHTHREASHQINLDNGKTVIRRVLSDWRTQGHYLELNQNGLSGHYFKI